MHASARARCARAAQAQAEHPLITVVAGLTPSPPRKPMHSVDRFALLSALVALALPSASSDFIAPIIQVDLDQPPSERWKVAMLKQVEQHGWEFSFKPVLDYIATIVPEEMWIRYDLELQLVAEPIVGAEMTAELRGVHAVAQNVLKQRITVSELLFFQIFYEILMQCTGVLARSTLLPLPANPACLFLQLG
eukprot:SAG11_NODE_2707_length_3064_cov_1.595278_5_plen_192_part_00